MSDPRSAADSRPDHAAARSAFGRLRPPFPVNHCANEDCTHGAFLYRDLESDKLVVFCGDCARHAELNAGERFKLVAL
jgi:cAMP phosphodiesterase